ncbi:MAG: alpha/beta hydrolase [Bacteroidetes bacterium]|nr:MAG: alpha/beta hydrolase [Bacteroidota bacterium]
MFTYYLIPGIVADHRAFQYVCEHLDLGNYAFIRWIAPQPGESLPAYAGRLARSQIDPASRPAFIGVSMGGIVAAELSRMYPDAPIALIASAKCRYELPPYYRRAGVLNPEGWLPVNLIQQALLWMKPERSHLKAEYYQLFRQMLLDTPPDFFRWALGAIARWERSTPPRQVLHLHGTHDKLLPRKYIGEHLPIAGGKHFMIVEKAPEIAAILSQWQSKIQNLR